LKQLMHIDDPHWKLTWHRISDEFWLRHGIIMIPNWRLHPPVNSNMFFYQLMIPHDFQSPPFLNKP
jgi:hypothetical protein